MARRYSISHVTTYRYSLPVTFAPHVVRLTPRADSVNCLLQELVVSPEPLGMDSFQDAFGNRCTRLVFATEPVEELQIRSRLTVENLQRPEPPSRVEPLPWFADRSVPTDYFDGGGGPAVAALARHLLAESGRDPLVFLDRLCQWLYGQIDRHIRVEGAAQSPDETLSTRRGACRDLTVLFSAVCRSQGMASRFVSGYQGQEDTPDGKRHLHAWPEVWIPGTGWLGWDPTHGKPTGAAHVALCAAPDQEATMPVQGGFYFTGSTITSTLEYAITFE